MFEGRPSRDGFSCNDWGCGYGAMLHYVLDQPSLNLTRYMGYDICDEMLEEAGDRYLGVDLTKRSFERGICSNCQQ